MDNEEIIAKLCESDFEFNKCFEEHIKLEQDLEALYSLKFCPPEVEKNIKDLKRQKLKGKDFMDQKLLQYKKEHNIK